MPKKSTPTTKENKRKKKLQCQGFPHGHPLQCTVLSHHHHNYNLSASECRRMVENISGLSITCVQPLLTKEWASDSGECSRTITDTKTKKATVNREEHRGASNGVTSFSGDSALTQITRK